MGVRRHRRHLPDTSARISTHCNEQTSRASSALSPLPSPRLRNSYGLTKSNKMSGLNYKAVEFVPGQFKYTPPAAAAPPPPPEPVARPELAEAPPPPPTITLNIGGSKPVQPPPPSNNVPSHPPPAVSQPSATSKPAAAPAPAAQATPKPKSTAASGTSTPTTQNKTYTMERARTDADGVLHDAKAAADQDTLKDLFGDGAYAMQSIYMH